MGSSYKWFNDVYNTNIIIIIFFTVIYSSYSASCVKPFLSRVEATKSVKIFSLSPIDNRNVLFFCLHGILKHKRTLFYRVD